MKLKAKLLAASFMLAASTANAQSDVTATIFAVDISGSVGHLFDQIVANETAEYVTGYIAGLDDPHKLWMLSFGEPGLAHRLINIKATVTQSRASSARTLSAQFGGYFRSLPALVQSGDLTPQNTTSIIEFLRAVEPVCERGGTRIIMFTDGVEWSSTVDGPGLMNGSIKLPMPGEEFLKGCQIEMLGVGQVKGTMSAEGLARRLVPQWEAFLDAAGADTVRVTGSFYNF